MKGIDRPQVNLEVSSGTVFGSSSRASHGESSAGLVERTEGGAEGTRHPQNGGTSIGTGTGATQLLRRSQNELV